MIRAFVNAVTLLILCLAAGRALAGDAAVPNMLGFSPSGHYAAFEEYGRQDGSGFAYATITIVNTRTDQWVGTPFRVVIENERSIGLVEAREAARAAAAGELARLQILDRGYRVSTTARGPDTLAFVEDGLGYVILEVEDLPVGAACAYEDRETVGYRLALREGSGGGLIDVWHADTSVPASRGCPWTYDLAEVHALPRPGQGPVLVAVLAYDRKGFEGPDRRHLIVARTYDEALRR
ncbi:MAG: DUF2259 domain-containing protein [Pseudomonadota bacterium]